MSLMNNKLSRIVLIWVAILFIVSVLFYFFILHGKMAEVEQKENELAFAKKKVEALKERKNSDDENDWSIDEIKAQIPETFEEDQLIRILNSASNRYNTTIETFRYLEESETNINQNKESTNTDLKDELKQLKVQINGQSNTLFDFQRFIESLETSDRLIIINQIDYQNNNEQEITFQIVLSTFAY